MLRRTLAFLGILMALAGFVLIVLSIRYDIHYFIPIGLILGSFLLLLLLRRMPVDSDPSANQTGNAEAESEKE